MHSYINEIDIINLRKVYMRNPGQKLFSNEEMTKKLKEFCNRNNRLPNVRNKGEHCLGGFLASNINNEDINKIIKSVKRG